MDAIVVYIMFLVSTTLATSQPAPTIPVREHSQRHLDGATIYVDAPTTSAPTILR